MSSTNSSLDLSKKIANGLSNNKKLKKSMKTKKKLEQNSNCHKEPSTSVVGHVLRDGETRTNDIYIDENVQFSDMYLIPDVLAGLKDTGFLRPSPVQLQVRVMGIT